MLGKDIAKNLKESKRGWGRLQLCSISKSLTKNGKPKKVYSYCVLGLKAREAGVSSEFLVIASDYSVLYREAAQGDSDYLSLLQRVYDLNDKATTKEELIQRFDVCGEVDYPIEHFIKYLKTLEKEWKAKRKNNPAL